MKNIRYVIILVVQFKATRSRCHSNRAKWPPLIILVDFALHR